MGCFAAVSVVTLTTEEQAGQRNCTTGMHRVSRGLCHCCCECGGMQEFDGECHCLFVTRLPGLILLSFPREIVGSDERIPGRNGGALTASPRRRGLLNLR